MLATSLTPKQLAFVENYLIDFNGTQAALRAGYAKSGAHVQAARLLSNDKVCAVLNAQRGQILKKNEVTKERVLEEYRRLAFNDVTDMIEIRPGVVLIKSTDELTPEQRAAVASIKQTDKGAIEVKFYDKQKALDGLAKHLGMFSDKNTGQNSGAGPTQILIQFGGGEPQALTDSQHTDRLIESEQEADNGE